MPSSNFAYMYAAIHLQHQFSVLFSVQYDCVRSRSPQSAVSKNLFFNWFQFETRNSNLMFVAFFRRRSVRHLIAIRNWMRFVFASMPSANYTHFWFDWCYRVRFFMPMNWNTYFSQLTLLLVSSSWTQKTTLFINQMEFNYYFLLHFATQSRWIIYYNLFEYFHFIFIGNSWRCTARQTFHFSLSLGQI